MNEREIVRVGVHGHPGHSSGTGRCGICEAEGVPLAGDVWLSSEDLSKDIASLEMCGGCVAALAGLARLAGTRGKLLKLELLR